MKLPLRFLNKVKLLPGLPPIPGSLPVQGEADMLLELWGDEKDAIRKYREFANFTKDQHLKSTFLHIAQEEEHHRDELVKELGKEGAWHRRYY